mgnify:CR=1 FL=1
MGLRLSLTGRPSLTDGNGRSLRLPRKAFALAAHLVIDAPKARTSREAAARFLWGEAEPSRRAGNLRQLLARVKEAQTSEGFELFLIETDHVALDAADIDVETVRRARSDITDRRLYELARAYCGDLLTGLDEGGEEFTRWLWARRAMLREQFVAVAAANVEAAVGILEADEVVLIVRRLIDADHYQEAGHRALMRVHAARGEFDSAFRVHRRLVDLLREVNGRPSNETAALVADIAARARGREGATEADGPAEPAETAAPALGVSVLPRLSLAFAGLADLAGAERDWAEALFEDTVIHLWRTRAFAVSRVQDLRPRPIDLLDRGLGGVASDYRLDFRVNLRDGHRVVTANLVDVASGEILWIHRFDVGEALPPVVRDTVVNCLHHVEQAELRILAQGPDRTTAHRLMLQGNRLLRSIDLPSIRRARQAFRSVLNTDPGHAPTLAAISKAYRLEWLLLARSDDKELDLAIDFARQSIAAGPDGVHGLHQFGISNIYKKDYERGLSALARAEKHFPFQAEVVAEHADGLICYGDLKAGLEKFVPVLDDEMMLSDPVLWNAACGNYLAGNYRETLELIARMSTEEPVHHLKAACLAMLGDIDEARRQVAKLRDVLPDFSVSKRLSMAPLRRREDREHYEFGLKLAGFD